MFNPYVGGISRFSLGSIISTISKTLGTINQALPIIKEARPIINNARSLYKVAKGFNTVPNKKVINDNNLIEYKNTNVINNINNEPTFFI